MDENIKDEFNGRRLKLYIFITPKLFDQMASHLISKVKNYSRIEI